MSAIDAVDVRISESDLSRLRAHLLIDPQLEQHAFLFARPSVGGGVCRLLVRDLWLTRPEQLSTHTNVALDLEPSYIGEALDRCRKECLSLIEAHSHPFCDQGVRFSHTDVSNEREKFPWLAGELPHAQFATLVFGQASVDGHYWDRTSQKIRSVRTLRSVGSRLMDLPITSCHRRAADSEARFARQVMAFGKEAQAMLGEMTVGIVGVGGLGCVLAQNLVYLGVRSFVLVDPDCVESTNLNRLIGALPEDAALRKPKVDVMQRMITAVAPSAKVMALRGSVVEHNVQEALKNVDVVFGGTDSDGARLVINRLAVAHLIPYLDLGTGLEMTGGRISAAGGQIWTWVPGGYCLDCTGSIDRYKARVDLMDDFERQRHIARGYGSNEPAPSVVFLNALLAAAAVGEFLGLVAPYKPLQTMIAYDAINQRVESYLPPSPRHDCPTCARTGFYALGNDLPLPSGAIREIPTCDISLPDPLPIL